MFWGVNMNRNTILTSLTTAALAGLFLTGNVSENVKADVKPDGETTKAKTAEENAQADVDSAQKDVDNAQQEVNTAKADLDSAQSNAAGPDSAYSDQQAKTDAAKKTETDKKSALDKADDAQKQAEALVNDSKNPDKVKQANDDVTAKSGALDTAKKEQTIADKNASDQDEQVKQDQSQVNDLTKTRDNKQNDKNTADQKVKDTEDALKGTGIKEAKDAVDTYQKNFDNLNENIKKNQGILKHNQDILKQNQDKLTPANTNLSNAKKAIKNASNQLTADNTKLSEKKTALDNAKKEAQSAAGFFKSLAEDTSLTAEQRKDAQQAYGIVMNDGKYQGIKLTWYDPSKQLGKDGDATSLANIQATLSDLDDLVNVRKQYNLRQPKVSLTAMAVAMMSSDYLLTHEFDHPILHKENGPFFADEQDIAEGAGQVGLYMNEKEYIDHLIQEYPEYARYSYDTGNLSYDQWKANNDFWEQHGLILYGGGDRVIGHYVSMVNPYQDGVGMGNSGDGIGTTDIIADLKYKKVPYKTVTEEDGTVETYYNLVPIGVNENPNKGFTIDQYKNLVNNYVANPNQANFVQAAQKAVDYAQSVVNDDQNRLTELQDEQDRAQSNVDSLNKAISETQKAIENTNNQINTDQIELGKQKNNLSQVQDRLNTLTASQDQKIKNFNAAVKNQKKAEIALTEAQSNLDKATNTLNAAKDKLNNLQSIAKTKAEAVKNAQDELATAQKRVEDLKNAPQILAQANDAQAKAQKEYDAAKKVADEAQAQLNKLESAKSTADAQVSAAQAEYNAALAKLKAAEDKLANAKNSLKKIKQSESLIDQSSSTGATETSSKFKRIRLTHNAYVYTKSLKIVKHKTHKNTLLKKGHYIKAWNKGKIVTIKGKKFYQIGKNRFVKVANAVAKKAKKSYVLAVVKGRKNHKVRVYLENGKFAKKYVYGQKTYKLAEKKTTKGKTYYRIYGKKLWVCANKIDLKK